MASPSRHATLAVQPLQELRSSLHTRAQSTALKKIKCELSGHVSRKVEYIQHGLIPLLADLLHEPPTEQVTVSAQPSQDDEQTFTQVAQLLCVIAHEGPAFVHPILETDLVQRLVSYLSGSPSSQTALAILRCLNAVAGNLPPTNIDQWPQDGRLADLLYSKQHIQCLGKMVGNAGDTVASQQTCDAALALLCKTVQTEQQKRGLVDSGLLTLLCARLASFVVAEGLVPPGSEALGDDSAPFATLPDPAPSFAHLSPVLEALSVLTEQSKSRTALFLADPTIRTVLPDPKDGFSPADIRRAPWGASYFSGGAVPRSRLHGPFDCLLPSPPVFERVSNATQVAFPPLGSIYMPPIRTSWAPTPNNPSRLQFGQDAEDKFEESPVVSWLLYVARESRGKRRLLAARLLVNLYGLDLVKKERGHSFATLLVPLLSRMLENDPVVDGTVSQTKRSHLLSNGLHYSRAAPAVLAALVMDDSESQNSAVESHAIANLAAGLKSTFDPPTGRQSSPWQPFTSTEPPTASTSPATTIGRGGPTMAIRSEMEYREGCLQALAAIAPFEDDYRKEICDQGALAHIMQALEPYQVSFGPKQQMEVTGNSAPVILAACGAVRMLTRSVKALRTKLVEAEVAKPIVRMMSSTNPEVRIAATRVLANLVIDFSPMKESVSDSTVVKKLCEQAHSANARLRLESLWALKQLVLNASQKLKQDVVDELGSSWIKLLIKTDPINIPRGEVIGLVEREYPAPSRQTRSAGPVANPEDVIMSDDDSEGEDVGPEEETAPEGTGGLDTRHTTEDDTEIQAQLLDLLRNLFCGDNASELVDYVFDEMGADDFFRMMLDRLRPRTLAGPTRKDNSTTPAPATIVVKVLYILVHIGACAPKYRDLMVSQQALLKQVLTYTTHADREVRAQCCWITINLIYDDEVADRPACRQRALDLQKLGFIQPLGKLESDRDLNVRERAKSAIHLFSKLIYKKS